MPKLFSYIFVIFIICITALVVVLQPKIHKNVKIDENTKIVQPGESLQNELSWGVWHSSVLNKLMQLARSSPDNQPEGTLNYIEFDVDSNQNIINIKIYSEPEQYSQSAKKHFSEYVRALNGDKVLVFPKDSQRKITHFKATLQKASKTTYSKPEDFVDYEIIQH